MTRQCEATTTDGTPCQAPPREGRPFCFFHDPEAREARQEANRSGGRSRWKEFLSRAEEHGTPSAGVVAYLRQVLEDLQEPGLEPAEVGRLRACCYAASVALKAAEQSDLSVRVESIERTLKARESA